MPRDRVLAAALLAGLVVLHSMGTLAASLVVSDAEPFLIIPLASGQCALLAWWVGMTRVRAAWRFAGWCMGTALLLAILTGPFIAQDMYKELWTGSGPPPHDLAWYRYFVVRAWVTEIAVMAPFCTILAMMAGWGLRRWQISLTTPFGGGDWRATKRRRRKWQFTLADSFAITSAVCVMLSTMAWTGGKPARMFDMLAGSFERVADFASFTFYALSASFCVFEAFLAAEITLGRPLLGLRWAAFVAFLWPLAAHTLLTFYTAYVLGDPFAGDLRDWLDGIPRSYRFFLYRFAFLAGSFLVVRMAGCRLVRAESNAWTVRSAECSTSSTR